MQDSYRRDIRYLRLSLTQACPMRCVYCRPSATGPSCAAPQLTPLENQAIVRHLVSNNGLCKVRLTGGEPTTRRDLLDIIERVAAIEGLTDLAMTTNGLRLAALARPLADAGLKRVNVSLDTLDRARFAEMTGIDGLDRVMHGIDAAIEAGLRPVKLNTVVVRGANERDLPALVAFAATRGVHLRFIELMPMGPLAAQWAQRYVSAAEMRRSLSHVVHEWRPLPQGSSSARSFDVTLRDGRRVTLGFIAPMSCQFCAGCDRLRLTADGGIYPCLMDRARGSLLPALRPWFDADHFDRLLTESLMHKAAQHPQVGVGVMTRIGG